MKKLNSANFYNSRLYNEIHIKESLERHENLLSKEIINKIICNSSENMKELPDSSIHLMITSPPYNVGKKYEKDLSLSEYLKMLEKVFSETYRVLVNGGRACINIANLGRKPYIPLSDFISKIMIEIGFNMRGEIIWNKSASAGSSTAWGSWQSASDPTLRDTHEYILIFSKGNYKRYLKEEEKLLKKNTIGKSNFMEWTKSIWDIETESAKRIGHPAPFPMKLPCRLIELYSFTRDVILDPFIGSGTTAIAAIKLDRNFVGYEIHKEYIQLAEKRISANLNPIRF